MRGATWPKTSMSFTRSFQSSQPSGRKRGAISARAASTKMIRKKAMSARMTSISAYTVSTEDWWKIYAERRFLAGGFDWTGFDYRGEPSPHKWPCISSHFGAMDTCGFPKDNYFYYQAWCGSTPVLHLFPHWNWEGNEGREIAVWCHTNLDSVELFRNGARLGSRKVSRNSHVDLECEVRARRARGARFKRREGRVS